MSNLVKLTPAAPGESQDYDYERGITPQQWFPAVCLKAKFGKAKKPPFNDMISLAFGVDGDGGGVRVDYYISQPNKASRFRTVAFRALGYENADKGLRPDGSKGDVDFDVSNLVGLECEAKCKIEVDQAGKQRARIHDLRPAAEGGGPNAPKRRYQPQAPDEIEGEVPFDVPPA